MDEIEFSKIVDDVCKRPRAYMPVGTLGHVISYLEGYSKAAGLQPSSHSGLSRFFTWLEKKVAREHQGPIKDLFDCSTTDEKTINGFARLYKAYAEEVASAKENNHSEEQDD